MVSRLERGADADEIYDGRYYAEVVDPLMATSAGPIADSIACEFSAGSVIDVGCGSGALMLALEHLGIRAASASTAERLARALRRAGAHGPPAATSCAIPFPPTGPTWW